MSTRSNDFTRRLKERCDELKWLYMELYEGRDDKYNELLEGLELYYKKRSESLKLVDDKREKSPDWYLKNQLVGMMLYTDNFADNLKGVINRLDYIKESGINYIHLMPLLDTVEGESDGGYAVADYRKVNKKLGTMADLSKLTDKCHEEEICVCLDFVMNHTSKEHEWAKKARMGEKKYQDMYFFYDNYDIPAQYEKTVPEVFPKTAPGNFTYLPDLGKHVMTSFYPYQWDLNYQNPDVFNEMAFNLLFLANKGIDIIRIDAVPYIWKCLGTSCRNLPQVHSIVRMMRLITEVVCPSVLLLGEVVMEPKELAPYFGSENHPECHMLYNATNMCTLWHTVATRDTSLLRYQINTVARLPKSYGFINYIRCHDDIGWGLDYKFLKNMGMEEVAHKQYLNDYFLGNIPSSTSCGELYNQDPVTKDARFCATTASMCGIERGGFEGDKEKVNIGIQLDLMLHAFIMFQSGIPVIYSGDEIGAVNDWTYKDDKLKADDSRYIHRGKFNWDNAKKVAKTGTVEKKVHDGICTLEKARRQNTIFDADADVYVIETHNKSVLGMIRICGDEKMVGLFNFSDKNEYIEVVEFDECKKTVFKRTNKSKINREMILEPYEYLWTMC